MGVAVIADGDYAAVGDGTDGVFELDGGVMDMKPAGQNLIHAAQDDFALRCGHVIYADVAGQCVCL